MDVRIPCGCPEQPHDFDTVTLRERLDFRQASAIKGDIALMKLDNPEASAGQVLAVLSEGYMLYGIESWTLIGPDEKGKIGPLPVSIGTIRERIIDATDLEAAMLVADAADDLYARSVMRPLFLSASPSSPDMPTEDSTSPEPSPSDTAESTPRPTSPTLLPPPSKRSSTSTTRTGGTGRTTASRDGDSSSSRNSTSAA